MATHLMGLETEYGLAPLGRPAGNDLPGGDAECLVAQVAQRWPHLPSANGGGIFLGNGARFYVDPGEGRHPEYSTPEVTDPAEVVTHTLAGEAILFEVAEQLAQPAGSTRPLMFRANIDYESNATWACHENYSHHSDPMRLADELIPHLVSRIIYTGAGGLNPHAAGVEFCLSPRVFHLSETVSPHSTHTRGIFHLKDESLSARGWRRLHLLCGESVSSHTAAYLKFGATALLVALANAGHSWGAAWRLVDPVGAMRAFTRDLTLQAKAELRNGRLVTALELQQQFLEFVLAHLDDAALPAWAPACCVLWRNVLERLARGAAAVSTRLDWAIKEALYTHHLRQRGFTADELVQLNHAAAGKHARKPPRGTQPWTPLLFTLAADAAPPAPERVREFLRVRAELCELEIRFAQLGPHGLFSQLDRAGQLQHRLPAISPERVQAAMREPPAAGRAHWRGLAIQQLHGNGHHSCDWACVQRGDGEALDLSNPLQAEMPPWARRSGARETDRLLAQVHAAYSQGNYDGAFQMATAAGALLPPDATFLRQQHLEYLFWIEARRGRITEASALVREWSTRVAEPLARAIGFAVVGRFRGLVPAVAEMQRWLDEGDEILGQYAAASSELQEAFGFREHKAAALLATGRWEEARDLLRAALEHRARTGPRTLARALATLGEIHRRLGERDEAQHCADQAEPLQTANGHRGDLAEFTLPLRAKLATDATEAMRFLERAEEIQTQFHHQPGLARTLFLKARIGLLPASARRHRRRLELLCAENPALAACPLAQRLLRDWRDWWNGRQPDGERDRFWGL